MKLQVDEITSWWYYKLMKLQIDEMTILQNCMLTERQIIKQPVDEMNSWWDKL